MYADIRIPRDIYASEEHQMMRGMIREFIQKEISPFHEQWEENQMVDRSVWTKAGELGLLCIDMPTEYGGMGLDFSFSALVMEELSRHGFSGPGFSLHSDIVAPYLLKYGSEAQKMKYLPQMAQGTWIASLGMTEPGTGSDVQAIRTKAEDKGDYYLLNGSKTFITNGYLADFCLVACKTHPGTEQEGVSMLIVDANSEGFSKGKPFKKMGLKAQDTCELFFEDVKVPKENLLGQEGKGFIYMMTELARERLTVAIQSIGVCEGSLEETIQYTLDRSAFNQPIAGFQNTQFKLAEQATQLQIHQVYVDKCIQLLMEKRLSAEQASMAKYTASDMAFKLLDECVQLHGGYGFMWEFSIARNLADSRVARIYAGTNEIMKLVIARGLLKEYFAELKAKRRPKSHAST